jgi:hypothetical protein
MNILLMLHWNFINIMNIIVKQTHMVTGNAYVCDAFLSISSPTAFSMNLYGPLDFNVVQFGQSPTFRRNISWVEQ